MAERIRINGKAYKVPAMEDLSLDDIIMLDAELQDRYRSSWVKVQQYVEWSQGKTETEVEQHPMSTLMAGVTVWMVLRVSGGQAEITMQEALAIPPTAIEDVERSGPKDRLPSKKQGKKGQARRASVPAIAPAPAPPEDSSPPTSSSSLSEPA